MNLTENHFWDKYWRNIKLPSEVNMRFSFDRCLALELKKYSHFFSGSVFEIGCAPGKWLAYFYKEFGLAPYGIESSEQGMLATTKNFKKLKINSEIIHGDLFATKVTNKFDVVMSFGFIEHFELPDKVIAHHLKWLKNDGILIIGIPNFSNINGLIQSSLNEQILKKHNLNIMNLEFFDSLAYKFKIKKISVNYIGSFEPSLPIPGRNIFNIKQFLIRSFLFLIRLLRKLTILDNLNSKYFSSYILAIYRK